MKTRTQQAHRRISLIFGLGLATLATLTVALPALAADKAAPKAAASPAPEEKTVDPLTGAEKVNVENIKEKYWARGDEAEMGVVQNRLYSKSHKLQLGMFVGTLTTDPFLDVRDIGATVGYNFSEYLSANLLFWKAYVSDSSAATYFYNQYSGAHAPSNPQHGWLGGEAAWSALYGKLSVLGKAIIYYDMNLMGGLGVVSTDSGSYATEHVGIGQKVWINHNIALRLDYRLVHFHETLLNYNAPGTPSYGTPFGDRENWTHSIILGVDFLIGVGGNKQ